MKAASLARLAAGWSQKSRLEDAAAAVEAVARWGDVAADGARVAAVRTGAGGAGCWADSRSAHAVVRARMEAGRGMGSGNSSSIDNCFCLFFSRQP